MSSSESFAPPNDMDDSADVVVETSAGSGASSSSGSAAAVTQSAFDLPLPPDSGRPKSNDRSAAASSTTTTTTTTKTTTTLSTTLVFVSGLAEETHCESLSEAMRQFGAVRKALILMTSGRSRGCGFVRRGERVDDEGDWMLAALTRFIHTHTHTPPRIVASQIEFESTDAATRAVECGALTIDGRTISFKFARASTPHAAPRRRH